VRPAEPDDYPSNYRGDEWSEAQVIQNASIRATVPADADSIAAALLAPRR
jgi:hypothetical protein